MIFHPYFLKIPEWEYEKFTLFNSVIKTDLAKDRLFIPNPLKIHILKL